MRWKFTFRNQLYSENRMERKTFVRQTLKVFFGVCAQVGCFERRHETEIYCILLRCVEGTLGLFLHHQPAALKSNKNMWHKRLIRRPQLARVVRRFSVRWRSFCHGVTSATSVWSGSCAVYTSDGIFGAAPWLHQVLDVIRSTFIDSPFAATVTWFWMISTN